jgi:hypothetical protein
MSATKKTTDKIEFVRGKGVAQDVQQRRVRRHLDGVPVTVDVEFKALIGHETTPRVFFVLGG